MIDSPTFSITATQPRTGVNTLEVTTSPVRRALRIDGTFRSTGHIWVSKVFRDTLTGGSSIAFRAHGIAATWRRAAGVYDFSWHWWCCYPSAGNKSIASVARITFTQRKMIGDITGCMHPAHPGTWVHTMLVNTSFVTGTFSIHCTFRFTFNVRVANVISNTGT